MPVVLVGIVPAALVFQPAAPARSLLFIIQLVVHPFGSFIIDGFGGIVLLDLLDQFLFPDILFQNRLRL